MRRDLSYTLGALGFLGLAACGQSASPPGDVDPSGAGKVLSETTASNEDLVYGARARARLFGPEGERIGDVIAWQGRDGVLIEIAARDLPLGTHGVHIHSVGTCEDVGVYKASGGHVGKDDGPHGLLHPDGAHRGDLPNLHVTAAGTTGAEFFSALISVSDLTDADGAALIIHAARDDWQTQPIGGAGARIACARFRPKT